MESELCGTVYQILLSKMKSVNSFKGRLDTFWDDQEVKIGKLRLKVLDVEVI